MCYFALGDKQGDLHTPAIAESLCNTDTKRNKEEGGVSLSPLSWLNAFLYFT